MSITSGLSLRVVVTSACTLMLTPSFAQIDTSCRDVYMNATRDISQEVRDFQEYDFVFDRYCERDGSSRKLDIDTKVGIILDDLPINLTSNKSAREDKLKEFCKNYSSQRFVSNRYVTYKNDVQVAALQQFNECIDFQTRGIAFSSAEIGLTAGTISGQFKNRTTALVINAVVYDDKLLTCTLSSGDINVSPDLTKRQAFPVKENFSIACQRSVQIDRDRPYFPPADARIETNEGGYSAHFAGDALNGYYIATEAKQKTEAAIAERDKAAASLATLMDHIGKANVRVYRFYNGDPGGDAPLTGPRLNCGDVNGRAANFCGKSKFFVSGVPGLTGLRGGRCGYDHFNVACLDLDTTH
ncbi:hypothetical protein IVB56_27185 [Bradyrhizobium sp. CW7]|uniref:hypothetical protein n=1 Tax=Bradyrhizobium sp. CW7 TaxID=2782688 RepID=UPI001FF9859A|nr:hypothetical protein [Bradyrhizobium sp. CW7]MCK1354633.1 hypothetical protein [Bradyrhizobium sp. CW7]